ncbi:MAG: hypothetical protein A3B68_05680 [Candidatus Melainabacteria bacterium RIFCSPHIGHO2_02_FULL_34_12]|nr:MAG: hypothetical protein A3B68_05680 [Candidatus Melainabacteria bacterium RIFCSPHIGHO2_02_FULL_34_12]
MKGKITDSMKKSKIFITVFLLTLLFLVTDRTFAVTTELRHKPATSLTVINYSRNLLYSIVDTNFRGSWVIDSKTWDMASQTIQKIQKSFDSLGKVKIGSSVREVKEILQSPKDTRNNGKIWIYGNRYPDGTYQDLFEVFFDEKSEYVSGIISFTPKNIVEDIGVSIGDPIDKMIAVYGEPVDEEDFIEDPENKDYLGLYYLYPRSGIGFLIGQDKATKNLLVHGVLVYGKI